jgi:transposase
MAKPYSMDLRERAMVRIAAGESARTVAAAFQVSVSSVVKWAQRQRRTGSAAPGKMGGHRPYLLSGEHKAFVLQRIADDPHVTLRGLAAELSQRGLAIDHATVGRFLHREKQSFKKKPCWPRNRSGPRLPAFAPAGKPIRARLIRAAWFSSTRPGSKRIWRLCAAGAALEAAAGLCSLRALEDHDVPCRFAPR